MNFICYLIKEWSIYYCITFIFAHNLKKTIIL